MAVKLRLEFASQAALEDFLVRHPDIEDGIVACVPTDPGQPPPDPGTTPPNQPPVASLIPTSGQTVSQLWQFSTEGTGDPEGALASTVINWGDGSTPSSFPGLPPIRVTHQFLAAGTFIVRMTVVDSGGLAQTQEITITVIVDPDPVPPPPPDPPPPDPDPIPENQSPLASLAVQAGQFTGDPYVFLPGASDLDGAVASWSLDFGDSTTPAGASGPVPATVAHIYLVPGTFIARLTATDNGGLVGSANLTVIVQSPPATNQPPTVGLSRLAGAVVGDTFTFGLSASDPDGSIVSWVFSPGDGTAPVSAAGSPPATRTHVYTLASTYQASLQVTDNGGLSRTATLPVVVVSPTPPPTGHPYYDSLVPRADRRYAFPLRSEFPANYLVQGTSPPDVPTVYDPTMDAVVQTIDGSNTLGFGGAGDAQQVHLSTAIPPNTTQLWTFDHRLNTGWAYQDDPDPTTPDSYFIRAEKSYRWDLAGSGGAYPPTWFTIKHSFSNSSKGWNEAPNPPTHLYSSRLCQGGYIKFAPGGGTTIQGGEALGPIVNPFFGEADRWVRVWIYFDAANNQLSEWYADSVQGVVQRLQQRPWSQPVAIIDWRLEWDISAPPQVLNPICKVWTRNLVVLASPSLTYAAVQPLLVTTGL